jgi:hypothetical protein
MQNKIETEICKTILIVIWKERKKKGKSEYLARIESEKDGIVFCREEDWNRVSFNGARICHCLVMNTFLQLNRLRFVRLG